MAYVELSPFVYDCNQCHTRCDGISKGNYIFNDDASFSEVYEQSIIELINMQGKYLASKSIEHSLPDIEIRNKDGQLQKYLEVKVQQRTFMSIRKYLPSSNLYPSEAVALNLSDLLRYFEIEKNTNIPVTIVWVLINRKCIEPNNIAKLYFQTANELKKIYLNELDKRRFRRKSGEGDVVDGMHKGVVVNYHFSLKELIEWT